MDDAEVLVEYDPKDGPPPLHEDSMAACKRLATEAERAIIEYLDASVRLRNDLAVRDRTDGAGPLHLCGYPCSYGDEHIARAAAALRDLKAHQGNY